MRRPSSSIALRRPSSPVGFGPVIPPLPGLFVGDAPLSTGSRQTAEPAPLSRSHCFGMLLAFALEEPSRLQLAYSPVALLLIQPMSGTL